MNDAPGIGASVSGMVRLCCAEFASLTLLLDCCIATKTLESKFLRAAVLD